MSIGENVYMSFIYFVVNKFIIASDSIYFHTVITLFANLYMNTNTICGVICVANNAALPPLAHTYPYRCDILRWPSLTALKCFQPVNLYCIRLPQLNDPITLPYE